MVTPRLQQTDNGVLYPSLGELCPELHHLIGLYLPANDVWNLSRCNRAMSTALPSVISKFVAKGPFLRSRTPFRALRRAPLLLEFTVEGFRQASHDWAVDLVQNCPLLKRIRLRNCSVAVNAYMAIGHLHRLKTFEIENAAIDDFYTVFTAPPLQLFSSPGSSPSSSNSTTSEGTLSTESPTERMNVDPLFPSLERLAIVPMRSSELAMIVSHLPSLRRLSATLEAEDKPSRFLAKALTSLQSLTLNSTYSDKPMPMKLVKSFMILRTLETLDLSTGVDDNNIVALCKQLKGLKTLRIKGAHNLGEIGLGAIQTLPLLRVLYIDFGVRLSLQRGLEQSLLPAILRLKSMTSLQELTILLPHPPRDVGIVHESLRQQMKDLRYLQLGNVIYDNRSAPS